MELYFKDKEGEENCKMFTELMRGYEWMNFYHPNKKKAPYHVQCEISGSGPYKTRVNTSLPNLSVPKGCWKDGGKNRSRTRSPCRLGSAAVIRLLEIVLKIIVIKITNPIKVVLLILSLDNIGMK